MAVRQSTLHVPRPLEDFVLAYRPEESQYLFQAALPKKAVKHKADSIRKESKGHLLQNLDLTIGPNGQFPQVSLSMDASLNYLTVPYGVEVPLVDDERANADSEIAYDQRQVTFGLVALIARGYRGLAWLFLVVYVLPLLTFGAWRLRRPDALAAPATPVQERIA